MAAKFIVIEGPDGTGKSTLIGKLKDRLKIAGREDFVFTREPGGTAIGEQIRKILLDVNNTEMADSTEAYLYAAARLQHVEELILPSLRAGKNVISDRFEMASVCYQGYGRGRDVGLIKRINEYALKLVGEIHYIVLMTDPEIGLARKAKERDLDRLEMASLDFHRRVYEAYDRLSKEEGVEVVDASGTAEESLNQTMRILERLGVL